MSQTSSLHALVTGDVVIDWNLSHVQERKHFDTHAGANDTTHARSQPGGAALLAELIRAAVESSGGSPESVELRPQVEVSTGVSPYPHHFPRSYALWSQHEKKRQDKKQEDGEEDLVWRVEKYLGLDERDHLARGAESPPLEPAPSSRPDVIVLDDGDLGFRDDPARWQDILAVPESPDVLPWIVLKMAHEVADGHLWEELLRTHAERLVVIVRANDLRRIEVQVSRGLSWERTAQELAWELVYNPRANALSRCAHVVVSFGAAGALLASRGDPDPGEGFPIPKFRLFFDPAETEGSWEKQRPGAVMGYTTCIAAAIAHQLLLPSQSPPAMVEAGVQRGLAALRALHEMGYDKRGRESSPPEKREGLVFPTQPVARALVTDPQQPFAEADVPEPADRGGAIAHWAILEKRYPEAELAERARCIVRYGPEVALEGVPLGQFGKLLAVDRQEIESLRSIQALVDEYSKQKAPKQPLSIAVFGPPGSGKSFGIRELAKMLLPDQIKDLTFNLSQLAGPNDLLDALHQVRDAGLSGSLPLVFWDEFDTTLEGRALGWLRYFLAPMQDGHFQQGEITHPIGRAIFVFAGGTGDRIEKLGAELSPAERRSAKVPDFKSRLKGHLNVLGPNPRTGPNGEPLDDPYHMIRRAILLRGMLQRDARWLFTRTEVDGRKTDALEIDSGVLRAFLHTREYRHGARSMESLIAMSTLDRKGSFERSSLPSESQLDLHVNGREFLDLTQRIEWDLKPALIEELARLAHDTFCNSLRNRGYEYDARTDDRLKTHNALVPFDELPRHEREQNRSFVRQLPNMLARAGYVLVPSPDPDSPPSVEGSSLDSLLDSLAEYEHERWLHEKLEANWHYAEKTDKSRKLHQHMVPWRRDAGDEWERRFTSEELDALGPEELPEGEREKTRDIVRRIPEILQKVQYTIVRTRRSA